MTGRRTGRGARTWERVELKPVPETRKGEAKNGEGTNDGDEKKVDSNEKLGKSVTLQSWRAEISPSPAVKGPKALTFISIRMTVVTPEKTVDRRTLPRLYSLHDIFDERCVG